jgi:hypothetical protein
MSAFLNNLPHPTESSKNKTVRRNQFSENKQKEFDKKVNPVLESFVDMPKYQSFAENNPSTSDVFICPCALGKPCGRGKSSGCAKCSLSKPCGRNNHCGCANCSPNYQTLSTETAQMPDMEVVIPLRERSFITNLYVGSITVVGLFIAYRMIKKTV